MAKYLAMRIKQGALEYDAVISIYAQFKDEIDTILGR